jgi:hypothetical protein
MTATFAPRLASRSATLHPLSLPPPPSRRRQPRSVPHKRARQDFQLKRGYDLEHRREATIGTTL